MVGWHHGFNGHELGETPGDGEGPGAWRVAIHGVTESNMSWQLNNNSRKHSRSGLCQ